MHLERSTYIIDISLEQFSEYGEHYNVKQYTNGDIYNVLVITCNASEGNMISKAVINAAGAILEPHKDRMITEDKSIVICVGGDICCLSIPNLDLEWRVLADEACCFSIQRFSNGYIVHGELAITHISLKGEIIWQFSARDIFVTYQPVENGFVIENDIIKVTDWQGFEYHLDKNGNCIKEFKC
ncbi:MAG: hypothetical protein H6550_02755 [Chitinophagales bacterium]|nr:hypothetical protein [Chitinophagales bacterium]